MPYDPDFVPPHSVPLPTLGSSARTGAFNNGTPINHSRFSIVFNMNRGLATYTAHNIDGRNQIPQGTIPRRDNFRFDTEVPNNAQIDNDRGYRDDPALPRGNNPWDRGHLVRRAAMHWGDVQEATTADSESFFWTNIAPQHGNLHDEPWGGIEDWMLERAGDNGRACIFTGPVLLPDDPERVNMPGEEPIRIPAGFWKVLAINVGQQLRAAGFLVWQRDYDRTEPAIFDPHLEQVRITTIEFLTGISFNDLRNRDPLRFADDGDAADVADLTGGQPPAPVRISPSIVSAADILL